MADKDSSVISRAAPVAAAGLEILTGAALFAAPSFLARLLFGSEMGGSGELGRDEFPASSCCVSPRVVCRPHPSVARPGRSRRFLR